MGVNTPFASRSSPVIIEGMLDQKNRAAPGLTWLTYHLRWLLLVAAAFLVSLGPDPEGPGRPVVLLLAATGLYNLGLALIEYFGRARKWLPATRLVFDFALGLVLFAASGGSQGRLTWLGLLPGLTIAFHYQWAGAVGVTAVFLLAQAGLTLASGTVALDGLVRLAVAAAVMLPVTYVAARVAARLRTRTGVIGEGQHWVDAHRIQVLRQHARAIYEMSAMVSATLNYEEVLEAALNFGAIGMEGRQPSSSALVSVVLFFRDDQLHVSSGRRLTSADYRVVCPGREGVLGEVIRTGEPAIIASPSRQPELDQFVSFQGCRSLMALPLRARYETYGVVLYGHPQRDFFDEDQQALLVAVVNQAIIALQNAQLYRNLRLEKERLVEVQEEAQKKLARDLHDGPTQAIAALAMRANFVRRLLERDPKAAGEELFKMEDLARRTTKEIRHMLFTLRPLVLESRGLTAAVKQLAEKMRETHDQNVLVEAEPGIDDQLEVTHQGVLFYIIEEAVNNARKHAQAEHIRVRFKVQQEVLIVEIQDDGVGFNVGAVDTHYERRGSLGMVNMRERAEMVNGAVRIDSAEGRGTKITVLVPLSEAARDRIRG